MKVRRMALGRRDSHKQGWRVKPSGASLQAPVVDNSWPVIGANGEAVAERGVCEVRTITLSEFQAINAQRGRKWHQGDLLQWSPLEWAGAMCGEAGEAANVAKKLRRLELALPNREAGLTVADAEPLRQKLANECADTIIYALLLMSAIGADAEDTIASVFDQKSIEYGFPERARGFSATAENMPCSFSHHTHLTIEDAVECTRARR